MSASGSDGDLVEQLKKAGISQDPDAARETRLEAQRSLDHQIQTVSDIDTKAAKTLRVNVLLIGLILSVFSFGSDLTGVPIGNLMNFYTGVGIGSLILSCTAAAWTYTLSDLESGIDPQTIADLINHDTSISDFESTIAKGYAHWLNFNTSTIRRNAPVATATILLQVVGILFLSLGVYHGVIREIGFLLLWASIWVILVVVWRTGFVSQVIKGWKEAT